MIVSVDFDKTLTRPDVQEYVKELLARGVDVWVVTSRYDDLHIHRYEPENNFNNDDLWKLVDEIGIPRNRVRFTNMEWKVEYLMGTNVIWHLDDNPRELFEIKAMNLKTIGIQVEAGSWKNKCERLLKKQKQLKFKQ